MTTGHDQDGTQPDGNTSNADGTQPDGNTSKAGKMFSQAEVDALLASTKHSLKKKFEKDQAEAKARIISEYLEENNLNTEDLDKFRADPSAAERLQKKLATTEKQLNEFRANAEKSERAFALYRAKQSVYEAASKHKANDHEIVWHLIKDSVSFDDSGNPYVQSGDETKTLDKAIGDLLEQKPMLVAPSVTNGGAGSRPGGGTSQPPRAELLTKEGRLSFLVNKGF